MRCLFGILVILTITVGPESSAQPLSGDYTIGGNDPDFASITEATDALETHGVSGPVTFNIRPGVYETSGGSERPLYLSQQPSGASPANHITFQADGASGGNADNVILRRRSGQFDNGYVAHVRSSYVTLDKLTFEFAQEDTTITGVHFGVHNVYLEPGSGQNSIDSITVVNCKMISTATSRPGGGLRVVPTGSHIRVENNLISGAGDGIMIRKGNASPRWTNVTVADNIIRRLKSYRSPVQNALGTAILVWGAREVNILNNDIDYEGKHTGILGIRARGGGIIIDGNQIRNMALETYPFGNFTGISLDNAFGTRSIVMNNMISNFRKSVQGIRLEGSNIGVYHNSVVLAPGAWSTGYTALKLQGCEDVDIINNILLTRDAVNVSFNRILDASGTNTNIVFDHNVLFSEPFRIEFNGTQYDSLVEWQAAGFGPNSRELHPEFVSGWRFPDLHLGGCSVGSESLWGMPLAEVATDIDGQARDSQHPTIGADEVDTFRPEIFSPATFTNVRDEALHFASGDLDNDGDTDLAVVNNHTSNGGSEDVSLFMNDGDGNFSGPDHIPMGTQPTVIKIEDVDRDGFLDLIATTNHAPVIRWGMGGGNFTPPFDLPDPGPLGRVEDIAFIPWADNHAIWVLAQSHFGTVGVDSGWVSLVFHTNRTFHYGNPNDNPPQRAGMNPSSIAAADLNDDGRVDFVANDWATGKTTSFLNLGWVDSVWVGFSKQHQIEVEMGTNPIHPNMEAGDIDGDGHVDVLLGTWADAADTLAFLRNDGTGMLSVDYIALDRRRPSKSFSLMDYEGDGDLDIMTATNRNDLVLYLNYGSANFDILRACQPSDFGSEPLALLTAPLDDNASRDVAVLTGHDDIAVMHNQEFIPQQGALQFSREALNKAIPDGHMVQDTLIVNLSGQEASNHELPKLSNYELQDVNITIDEVLHPRVSDLILILNHAGARDTLISQAGDDGENFIRTRLDDQATVPVSSGTAPFTGSFQPEYPLEQFHGLDPEGAWILEIVDVATGNTGTLQAWQLELTFAVPTDVEDGDPEAATAPTTFSLEQNYPNPFNPQTTIRYQLSNLAHVKLTIHNVLGQQVRELVNKQQAGGSYRVLWDGRSHTGVPVASGMYFYRLRAEASAQGSEQGFVQTRKMLLLR